MADAKSAATPASMNLYQKLAAITGEVGVIAKDGNNTEQNFKFIEYAAVAGKLRDLFAKYGVVVVPRMQQAHKQARKTVTSKYGKEGEAVLIDMSFTVLNADKPDEKFTVPWTGEAIDYGDKATNKAATSALKYYLMRQFNISEKGEDPDAESPDRGEAHAAPARSESTPSPTPPPLQASEKQLTAIRETAKVKGRPQEWTDAMVAKFVIGKESKAAQSVIDVLNELEDSQEPSAPQQASPSRADVKEAVQAVEAEVEAELSDAEKVLEVMTDDEPPTEKQIERYRELREKLGYNKATTETRLKMLKSKGAIGSAISKMKLELSEQEAAEEVQS